MSAFQGKPFQAFIQMLAPATALPVVGLTTASFSLATLRPGELSLTTRLLAAGSALEVGGGFYILTLAPAETTSIGLVVIRVTAAAAVPVYSSFYVDPQPLGLLAAPAVCIVTGNVVELGGFLSSPAEVTVKTSVVPTMAGGTALISTKPLVTWTDALGNFSVALLRGATVVIEIPDCGLKGQFVVPQAGTAALSTLVAV